MESCGEEERGGTEVGWEEAERREDIARLFGRGCDYQSVCLFSILVFLVPTRRGKRAGGHTGSARCPRERVS